MPYYFLVAAGVYTCLGKVISLGSWTKFLSKLIKAKLLKEFVLLNCICELFFFNCLLPLGGRDYGLFFEAYDVLFRLSCGIYVSLVSSYSSRPITHPIRLRMHNLPSNGVSFDTNYSNLSTSSSDRSISS